MENCALLYLASESTAPKTPPPRLGFRPQQQATLQAGLKMRKCQHSFQAFNIHHPFRDGYCHEATPHVVYYLLLANFVSWLVRAVGHHCRHRCSHRCRYRGRPVYGWQFSSRFANSELIGRHERRLNPTPLILIPKCDLTMCKTYIKFDRDLKLNRKFKNIANKSLFNIELNTKLETA